MPTAVCKSLPIPVAHFLHRTCHILQHQAISHKVVAQGLEGSRPTVVVIRWALKAWVPSCVVRAREAALMGLACYSLYKWYALYSARIICW
jgi:hypothetical protein